MKKEEAKNGTYGNGERSDGEESNEETHVQSLAGRGFMTVEVTSRMQGPYILVVDSSCWEDRQCAGKPALLIGTL